MLSRGTASTKAVWFLIGPLDSAEPVRHLPIYTLPFAIGRRQGLSLSLPGGTVSGVHAEIVEAGNGVALRDLNSTNGSYVNGKRISEPVVLHQDDLVQFANVAFRVREQSARKACTPCSRTCATGPWPWCSSTSSWPSTP